MEHNLNITSGLRIGYWRPTGGWDKNCFHCVGFYNGPNLGEHIIGTSLDQKLIEGTLKFKVGVLFRPDLNKRQWLETILILETFVPEMFDYEDWIAA